MNATSLASLTSAHADILQHIARELSGDVNFPTCFQAFEHIRKSLSDPMADLEHVRLAVNQEPLIASRLLGLANSVGYSAGGPMLHDTASAIRRLGFNLVRTTALAIALDQMLKSHQLASCRHRAQELWQRSLYTAALSRTLARETGQAKPDEAMLLGLVHNIGGYYLLHHASQYPVYANDEAALSDLLVHAEHAVSTRLFCALGLPESLKVALSEQEADRDGHILGLGNILRLARALEREEPDPASQLSETLTPYRHLRELAAAEYQALLQALA